MNTKNWIRAVVLTAIVAYPGYETYRLYVAKQQLAASVTLKNSVSDKLTAARVKFAQANNSTTVAR